MLDEVKINSKFVWIKKCSIVIPVVCFSPFFFNKPSVAKMIMLLLFIIYYFFCFMGPIYFLRFAIKKFKLKQKLVDILCLVSVCILYIYTILNWYEVYFNYSFDYASSLFLIPFLAFLKMTFVVMVVVFVGEGFKYVFGKFVGKKKEKEEK